MTTIAPPPQPPVGQPPTLSPGGRTAVRVVLVAAAVVLLIGGIAALGVAAYGVRNVRVVSQTTALPATMRTLVIATGDIPVAIRITSARDTREPSARLRLVNTTRSGAHRLTVTTDGPETRVGIEGHPSPMLKWARGGEITVALPPEQARRLAVRTEQQIGVLLAQADVDELTARSTDGAVVLSGAARRIDVRTDNGDVMTRGAIAVAERFRAETSDGDIEVDFTGAPPRQVEAISRDGSVAIRLPGQGPYLVHAQSGASTRVRVPETTTPDSAVGQVTARSTDGDVTVEEARHRSR
jgi:Putative adhesin